MRTRKLGMTILLLVGIITASFVIAEIKDGLNAGSADAVSLGGNTLYVGGSGANNYTKIQDAIDNASDGDTIFVFNGTYYENVVITKTINLIGEDRNGTIIDGQNKESCIEIWGGEAGGTNISSFTLENTKITGGWYGAAINISGSNHTINKIICRDSNNGIFLVYAENCYISNCWCYNNFRGLMITNWSSNNIFENCILENNNNSGIFIFDSFENLIKDNFVENNTYGVCIYGDQKLRNIIYNNYFKNNDINAYEDGDKGNIWNISKTLGPNIVGGPYICGNYWSDYTGVDLDGDGLGDTNLPYGPGDWHPLVAFPASSTIYIDDDFNSSTSGWQYDHFNRIQDGINAVPENGIVYVYNGIYYENVVVNKTINLIGENKETTIIDGGGRGDVVNITANRVNISNFTISNGFSFTDIYGEKKSLSDYMGKVVILDMMATWCQPCQYEILELRRVYENYSSNELQIISVDIDSRETAQQLENFKETFENYGYNLDWTFGMDDGSIASKYLGQGIPTLCIFDQQGNLKFTHEGVCVYSDIPPGWPESTPKLAPIINNLLNSTDLYSRAGIRVSSPNNEIYGCIILNGYTGVLLNNSNYTLISSCNIYNNDYGIRLEYSSNNQIQYNNIYNNDYGINNFNSDVQYVVDAPYNYWGSPSGPYHPTLSPNGTGNNVSDNVNFTPWLTAPVKGGTEESLEEGENEVDAVDEADTSLEINATNNNTIRVISYEEAPVEEPNVVKSTGKYIQIEVENKTNVKWPMAIKIYYTWEDLNNTGLTEEQIIGIYFYNETSEEWQLYNNTGVNTTDIVVNGKEYAGYAWANAWHLTSMTIGADDNSPEISSVGSNPTTQETNGNVNISCVVTDNIETAGVFVNITYPDVSYHNFSMTNIGGTDVYYYNGSYSLQGNYDYFIWANDTSGNVNVSSHKIFSIFIPQYTLNILVSPENTGNVILSPSGGTYDAGTVVTVTVSVNSGYQFDHWSGNASGNNSTVKITMDLNKTIVAHFVEATPPNQPPTVAITSPSDNATVSGTVSIAGTSSDSDNTVQGVQVKIDSGAWIEATGTTSWSYSWDTTTVANGSHTIDGTDYSSIDSITVNVNNIPPNHKPTVEIIFPTDGMSVKKTFTIHGTASDAGGNATIQKVEIKIGDEEWKVVNGTTSWSYTWDSTTVDNGNCTIQARAYDGQEYSNIYSITVKVNNEKGGSGGIPGFEMLALLAAMAAVVLARKRKLALKP